MNGIIKIQLYLISRDGKDHLFQKEMHLEEFVKLGIKTKNRTILLENKLMKPYKFLFFLILLCSVSCKKDMIETSAAPLVTCFVTSYTAKASDDTYYLTYEYDSGGRRIKKSLNSSTVSYIDEFTYETSKITQTRKFKNLSNLQWIYLLNSDGTLASGSTIRNGNVEVDLYKYNKDGYLSEYITSILSTQYEYLNGNLSNTTTKYTDGTIYKTTYQYYIDKLDTHNTDYFIKPGLLGKGNKDLVKSYSILSNGNTLTVNESYTFDDKGNITQITHDSKDAIAQGVDKFTYDCH
jgi:hypothetical protein